MGQYYQPVVSRSDTRDNFINGMVGMIYSHDHGEGLKLMEHSYVGNILPTSVMAAIAEQPGRIVWAGDYADEEPDGKTLYTHADTLPRLDPSKVEYRYLLNLDRSTYVDLHAVPEIVPDPGWKIHPLPLLTVEGNGRGGGDFRGDNEHVGTWARDLLLATDELPEGLTEIRPDFAED